MNHVIISPVRGKCAVYEPVECVHADHGVDRGGQVLPLNVEGVQQEKI